MALKLSGALDITIMRVGRWTLLTYLTYIHTQIRALTAGLLLPYEADTVLSTLWSYH
jgi:hypothetical protein